MRKTLQQIRNDIRILVSQEDTSNTDFTDAELNSFINQGIEYLASLVEYPRDLVSIQVQDGYASYTLPTDSMKLLTANFGDVDSSGDCSRLDIITQPMLQEYCPNWLDNTESSKGRPKWCVLLDRQTVLLYPRPNSTEGAIGKKLYLDYVYYPSVLTADGEYPDLPNIYHQFVSLYAGHLCYIGKLKNPQMSDSLLKQCIDKAKSVQPQAVNEINDLSFSFGDSEQEVPSDVSLAYNRIP